MLNEPDEPGSIDGPEVGKLTFQPSPALRKYGWAGEFPICSTVSCISPPFGGISRDVLDRLIFQPATSKTSI